MVLLMPDTCGASSHMELKERNASSRCLCDAEWGGARRRVLRMTAGGHVHFSQWLIAAGLHRFLEKWSIPTIGLNTIHADKSSSKENDFLSLSLEQLLPFYWVSFIRV